MTSLSDNTVVTTSGGLVELNYSQKNASDTTITATTAATANEIISPMSIVCDGSPLLVEFFASRAYPDVTASGRQLRISLWQDGAQLINDWGFLQSPSAAAMTEPVYLTYRTTPSAGVHTFGVKAYVNAGTGYVESTTSAGAAPTYLRVSKILQASQFIVPLASAPLVTSLPSAPIDGQEIRYIADATNGVIWNLRYRAASSSSYKWEFIGGPPLSSQVGTNAQYGAGVTTSSLTAADLSGPYVTVPLAGDYQLQGSAFCLNSVGGNLGGCFFWIASDGATGWSFTDFATTTAATNNVGASISGTRLRTGLSASTQISLRYATSSGTNSAQFWNRYLSATPVRVG
jgi:hypothetical protein